jgi:hypothetical protein
MLVTTYKSTCGPNPEEDTPNFRNREKEGIMKGSCCERHVFLMLLRAMVFETFILNRDSRILPPEVSAFSLWQTLVCRFRLGGTQNLSSPLGERFRVRLLPG